MGGRGAAVVTVPTMRPIALAAPLAALAGCSWQGPPLAGYPGLQYKVVSFYDDHALERNAACPLPRMDAVQAKVVDETPTRVVMNVRYHWYDDSQGGHARSRLPGMPFPGVGQGSVLGYCNDWGERTFAFAKNSQGGLDVVSMTGPQREQSLSATVR
jgi:hypothetical protein